MRMIGLLDIFKKHSELDFMLDMELLEENMNKVHLKRLAIQTCINMIARTISQSEFRVKKGKEVIKDEMYYRLNVRPNKNMTASTFWQTVIYKLVYDNECLIIQSDTDDLLIADDFTRNEYPLVGDTFTGVMIKDFEYNRTFRMDDVFYFQYSNEKISTLIDGVFKDYGELFGRLVEFQKRKNQIRATVDLESINTKDADTMDKLQKFIDKMYKAISEKSVAIVPQQKGFTYNEKSNTVETQNVDDINKTAKGFLDHVAKSLGIPIALLHGEMADVEKQTRNYMTFCIDPLLKMIGDELNDKAITKKDFMNGTRMDIRRISYSNLFDLASSIDKLVSSGAFTGNEIRREAGHEDSEDPKLDKHIVTKNYQEMGSLEGGEKE
ncbi:phage portal protein [Halobacillus karajensis]|uniref:phage portal protein n=1 Tax=Halobacillus karajensis TaxID=195088 RepID=UPI000944E247|nr:phage portal protein [Halobacillus karajensis]